MPRTRTRPEPAGPLIAAVYAMLPAPDAPYGADKQEEWLTMMRQALRVTYGGGPLVPAAGPTVAAPAAPPEAVVEAPLQAPAQPRKKKPAFPFFVDRQSYARRGNGDRVLPADVTDILSDLRGEADLDAIVWADDSQGFSPDVLKGVDITVSAVFQ